jgi:hypothetical protein
MLVFITMTIEQRIKSFGKYIEKMIVPKFPEISHFDIGLSDKKDWGFREDWIPIINVLFYTKNMEDYPRADLDSDIPQSDLYYDLLQMKEYLSTSDNIRIRFKVILPDGTYGDDWGVV